MQINVVKLNDGSLLIDRSTKEGYDINEAVKQWPEYGDIEGVYSVEESDIPDYYFRGAWRYSDGLYVDMGEARNIHMDSIRVARDKAIADLDTETLRGVDVQSEKQVLRDIPQTFDLSGAGTPEELKQLWPEELV